MAASCTPRMSASVVTFWLWQLVVGPGCDGWPYLSVAAAFRSGWSYFILHVTMGPVFVE